MPRSVGGVIRKGVRSLSTLNEWLEYAPPRNKNHWRDGRSAKENARLWLSAAPCLPSDIEGTLGSCSGVEKLLSWSAEPEAKVPFDSFRGPANIDLLLTAEDRYGRLVMGIEAKADEPFGDTVETTLARAHERLKKKPRSKGVERIDRLESRFELNLDQRATLGLRYQLLTITAAVIAEASRKSARRGVVLVHELVSRLTTAKKRARNARDLDHFLTVVFGHAISIQPGTATRPFTIDGVEQLYFGKARTEV